MIYTYRDREYSDLHKEAFGFRPSEETREVWNSMSPDQKQHEWELLIEIIVDQPNY